MASLSFKNSMILDKDLICISSNSYNDYFITKTCEVDFNVSGSQVSNFVCIRALLTGYRNFDTTVCDSAV